MRQIQTEIRVSQVQYDEEVHCEVTMDYQIQILIKQPVDHQIIVQ